MFGLTLDIYFSFFFFGFSSQINEEKTAETTNQINEEKTAETTNQIFFMPKKIKKKRIEKESSHLLLSTCINYVNNTCKMPYVNL